MDCLVGPSFQEGRGSASAARASIAVPPTRPIARNATSNVLRLRIVIVDLPYLTRPLFAGDVFDLAWPPRLREEGFERAVEPQDGEPAPAGYRLDPIAVGDTVGLAPTEIDRRRPVGVWRRRGTGEALAAGACEALLGLKHRARLVVVEGERPELRR